MHFAIDLLAFIVDCRIARRVTAEGPGKVDGYCSVVLGLGLHIHVDRLAPFVVLGRRRVGLLRWSEDGPWIPTATGSRWHVSTCADGSARQSYKNTVSDECFMPASYTMAPRAKAAA